MKKLSLIIVFSIVFKLMAIEIETNDLHIAGGFDQTKKNQEGISEFLIPEFSYEFEGSFHNDFTISLESEASFLMSKSSFDGKYEDYLAKLLTFGFAPSIKYELKNISFSLALPYTLINSNKAEKESEFETSKNLDIESKIEYSLLEEDIEGTTPWNSFENGYLANIGISSVLFEKVGKNETENMDYFFGGEVAYSYFNRKNLFMIKSSFSIEKHLNTKASEALGINTNIQFHKDLNSQFAFGIESSLNCEKPDPDANFMNGIDFELTFLYYPLNELELSVYSSLSKDDLTNNSEKLNFKYGIGIDFELFAK